MMNNNHIQYFNGLQQETAKFQNEARGYDRQRRVEEDKLKNIRLSQLQLEEKLRNISNELGQEIRTAKIEEEKNIRLKQAMASEHQAILQMTSELQGIEADETAQKQTFVKEMESLNNEIDFLLCQKENERLIQLLEGETVQSLVDTKLSAVMSEIMEVEGGNNNNNHTSAVDEMNAAAWTEISANITEGMKELLEAEEKVGSALDERKELEKIVKGLREKFAAANQNLGQMEIGSLEAKWQQKYSDDTNDDYMEDVEGKAVSNGNNSGSGSTAVHMELFYDNAEDSYSGPVFDANARGNVGIAC
jgi:hypothetical protein